MSKKKKKKIKDTYTKFAKSGNKLQIITTGLNEFKKRTRIITQETYELALLINMIIKQKSNWPCAIFF